MATADRWKRKLTRLNFTYLACLKEAGLQGDGGAQVWGVPTQLLSTLEDADEEVLHALAQVGAPLFRIQADQMHVAITATDSGNALRARASLLMRIIGPGGEDGGSGTQCLGDGA